MAKLELAILVGAESKAWLEKAEQLVTRLEELTKGKKNGKRNENSDAEEESTESEDDFEEETASKKSSKGKKKVQKAEDFDDEDGDDNDSDSSDDEEGSDDDDSDASEEDSDSEPVKKKGKGKKVTHEDAQTACKERVKREIEDNGLDAKSARAVVSGILKKKFKVSSVSDLDEDQYAEVVKVMKK
jgi:hypothetical protein